MSDGSLPDATERLNCLPRPRLNARIASGRPSWSGRGCSARPWAWALLPERPQLGSRHTILTHIITNLGTLCYGYWPFHRSCFFLGVSLLRQDGPDVIRRQSCPRVSEYPRARELSSKDIRAFFRLVSSRPL
eukprot:scaffold5985_cov112-Isochrysis_galbana.AAC.3